MIPHLGDEDGVDFDMMHQAVFVLPFYPSLLDNALACANLFA